MANINKELNQIKNAVYGKDVRGSIHDGIDKINKETEVATDKAEEAIDVTNSLIDGSFDSSLINANFEQRLDDEINNLQPDWTQFKDQTNSQLAQTATKGELTNAIAPKANKVYVDESLNAKRDKSVGIGLDDAKEDLLAAIAGGEGAEFNLLSIPRDFSVTHQKTTFAQRGKNLFNGNYIHGLIMTGTPQTGGVIAEREGGISVIVKLGEGRTYTASRSDDIDRFTTSIFKEYPVLGEIYGQGGRFISNNNSALKRTFTLESDEKYVMFYLSSTEQDLEPAFFQIEVGEEATEYESPDYVKVKLTEDSISDYELAPRSIKPYHLDFDIENGIYVNIERFGADVNNTDNKIAIQNAINYASSLVNVGSKGIVRVYVPEGNYLVNGTLYGKSRVVLIGNGIIKASDNADFDDVDWVGVAIPSSAKTLFAIVGTASNPIKFSGIEGVAFDYNGENQDVEPGGSYIGIAISHAEDCWAYETTSENVMYEKIDPVESPDKMRGLCLFVANAKRTNITGGRYWKSGYDSIRIAGGAEDTKLTNVFAGKAKRGAIQFTPGSNIVHLSNCTFDNREGGTSVSHAFFAHNLRNVYADNLTLQTKDGYCIAIFSDGNAERGAQSKFANLKNVVMENEEERFVSLTSLSDDYWTKGIGIQGIVLTTKKQDITTGHVPIYVNRCEGIELDLKIPDISMNPLSLQQVRDVDVKFDLSTDKDIYTVLGLTGNLGVENVTIHDSVIDAPNAQRSVNSNGTSDNIKMINIKTNTLDSVAFPVEDKNILIRDCDFREVQNADKLRLVATESIVIDNVLGA